MPKNRLNIKIQELKTDIGVLKNFELSIGKIIEEWEEKEGPTPFPSITDLREWDFKLLQRYKPFYMPFCDVCCLCTFGKCDLTGNKRGACGLNMAAQQSRIVLLACCIGAAIKIASIFAKRKLRGNYEEIADYILNRVGAVGVA